MRRRIVLLALALLACLCLCLPASAGSVFTHDGITVSRGVDPTVREDGIVYFAADRNRWRDKSGALLGRVPAEFEGATLYDLPTYLLEDTDYACVDFASPQDLSRNEFLRIVCSALSDGVPSGDQSLTVTLFAGEDSMVCTTLLPFNQWCAVDIDIGSWPKRTAVTRIEIRFTGTADLQFAHLYTDEPMDSELRERFLTDAFTARGGKVFLSPGASIGYLVATDSSPMLTATILVPQGQTETNALRFVFDNETSCKSVTLQYAYRPDGANARSVTHEVGAGRQICLFEVPDAARVRYIRLIFTGAKEGLITLCALNAVSIYETGIEHLGTITACAVSDDGREIEVKGTVAHDIMIANRQNRLALFVLDAWETVQDVLTDGRAPDATADISIRYAFSLPFAEGDYASLGAGYLVAIQTGSAEDGYTYTPIADPHSLSVPVKATAAPEGAIKGVQTNLVSTAGQAGVSIHLVDVYLDRLCDGVMGGYRNAVGGEQSYFNRDALDALDKAVRLRSAAGEAVYLRFLISGDGRAVDYAIAPGDSSADAARGILLESEAARDTVGAVTAFLTARYSGGDTGSIAGIIVGRQVDDAAANNDIGVRSLSDYVDHYADLLTLIANTARRQNPAMQVIVPISDRRPVECITAEMLESSYDSELFLRALFKRLDDLDGPAVSLMLESRHNPFSLVDGVLADPEEEADQAEPGTADEAAPDYYNADDLGDFSALVDAMSDIYASMPATFLYCWTPAENTGDALSAAYAYLYYRLRFSTHAEAFIVSFAEAEAAGDTGGMTQLRHLMKYIDTARSLEVSETALAVFGVDRWQALITDFDASALASRVWHEGELTASPGTARGRHVYWDFSAAHSTRGWYAGTYVGNLHVRGSGIGRSLTAEFARDGAETGAYSEIIYRFDLGEPLSVLDRLAFDLCIAGDGVWEICITAGSADGQGADRIEQKQVLAAGQRTTLCLTADVLGREMADYLKVSAKPVSGSGRGKLCLYTVIGESDSLDDGALDGRLRELRDDAAKTADAAPTSSLAWVFAICAVVIFTITIAVILGRRQDEEMEWDRRTGQ